MRRQAFIGDGSTARSTADSRNRAPLPDIELPSTLDGSVSLVGRKRRRAPPS